MTNKFRWAAAMILAAVCVLAAGGIVLTEAALHVRRVRATPVPAFAKWREVAISARDGAVLRARLVSPESGNGDCVITLHGVADGRRGTLGSAQLFVESRYTVLMPDSRGHGESGGEIATYGVLERDDVHRWVDWLIASEHPHNVFAMGESMGGGVLLQSLAVEHRFSAVVAESPFGRFQRRRRISRGAADAVRGAGGVRVCETVGVVGISVRSMDVRNRFRCRESCGCGGERLYANSSDSRT